MISVVVGLLAERLTRAGGAPLPWQGCAALWRFGLVPDCADVVATVALSRLVIHVTSSPPFWVSRQRLDGKLEAYLIVFRFDHVSLKIASRTMAAIRHFGRPLRRLKPGTAVNHSPCRTTQTELREPSTLEFVPAILVAGLSTSPAPHSQAEERTNCLSEQATPGDIKELL